MNYSGFRPQNWPQAPQQTMQMPAMPQRQQGPFQGGFQPSGPPMNAAVRQQAMQAYQPNFNPPDRNAAMQAYQANPQAFMAQYGGGGALPVNPSLPALPPEAAIAQPYMNLASKFLPGGQGAPVLGLGQLMQTLGIKY